MRERERDMRQNIGVVSQDIPTAGLSCYLWLNVSPSFLAELITELRYERQQYTQVFIS